MGRYTKGHYEDIVKLLNKFGNENSELVYAFVELFTNDNELFNEERFLKALDFEVVTIEGGE